MTALGATHYADARSPLPTPAQEPELCSGIGQYHSPTAKTNPRPLASVTMPDVLSMLDNPQQVEKDQAQWFIPSTLATRTFAEQREHGVFHCLWSETDDPSGILRDMAALVADAIGAEVLAYTTRSATEDRQKSRFLIPLAHPVSGEDFVRMQEVLNGHLKACGIPPDRKSEGAAQICYLPNRGAFYDAIHLDHDRLHPDGWREAVAAIRQREQDEQEQARQQREASQLKARERVSRGQASPIDAMNAEYRLPDVLLQYGYLRRGNRWLSPLSESGHAAVILSEDGRKWISSHGSDAAAGLGKECTNGCMGDVFDLFTHFEHGGNRDAALRAAAKLFELPDVSRQGSSSGTTPAAGSGGVKESDEGPAIISTEVSRDDARVILPPFVPELLALPHGLGRLQDFAHGRQKYPSRAMAAVTALVAMSHFAQAHITVASYGGLGLSEWYMALAPTGGGKQDARDTLTCLHQALADDYLANLKRSRVHFSAPASQQGLHKLLEADRAITILSDEFAEWLAHTHRDPHKQAALGFAMQVYSSALSTVAPPFAVTNDYSPVENPRMTVFATSTAERILETMTVSQADSGAYNRWTVLVAEQERIPKRYEGLIYDPDPEVLSLVRWVQALPPTKVQFDPAAWALFKRHDSEIIEPIKFEDPHLAGRLSEQAIKMAALIALSDRRLEIRDTDLRAAYAIRENLYHRARGLADHHGAMDDRHPTGVALNQVLEVLKGRPAILRGNLQVYSRKYRDLSVQDQRAVLAAVLDMGAAAPDLKRKALLRSLIYQAKSA